MKNLFDFVLVLSLVSYLIIILFGRQLGAYGSMIISCLKLLNLVCYILILFLLVPKTKKKLTPLEKLELIKVLQLNIQTARITYTNYTEEELEQNYIEWAGGISDADGSFMECESINPKTKVVTYIRIYEITVPPREVDSLYKLNDKFKGQVNPRSGNEAYRWTLKSKRHLPVFLLALNGYIFTKQDDYTKLMNVFHPMVHIKEFNFIQVRGWFSGFFEGDGHVNINTNNYQLSFRVEQKNVDILHKIALVFGGSVNKYQRDIFVWEATDVKELINLLEYFILFPMQSNKQYDIEIAVQYLEYRLQGWHKENSPQQFKVTALIKTFQENKILTKQDRKLCKLRKCSTRQLNTCPSSHYLE